MAKALTARVVKAISMLGSTQMFNMLCSVVRMQRLAVWIGPLGVGIMGVLMQTLEMVSNLTPLNIRTTAVRDVAMMPAGKRGETIGIVRRVGRALGLIGLLLMLLLAPAFSLFSFGSTDYSVSFCVLSLALFFGALQGSELVVLQAEGQVKKIASSGLLAAILGLVAALIMFRTLGVGGLAWVMVAYSLFSWLSTSRHTRNFRSEASALSLAECFRRSATFIRMGFFMVISGLVSSLVNYGFLAVIQRTMGSTDLGLYQAGNTMLIRYVGVFFTAISLEFYPRLSGATGRPRYASLLMTHQARVCSLIFFPLALLAMLLTPWLIRLLYDSEFLPMSPFFVIGMVGMMMRPASMILSFSFIASGKMRPYLFTEVASCLVGFALNLAGFLYGGWIGLGLSFALWYLFDLLLIYAICRRSGSPVFPPRTLAAVLAMTALLLLIAFALVFHGKML